MDGGDGCFTGSVGYRAWRACRARLGIRVTVWVGVWLGLCVWSAAAAERVALVLGNSAYKVGALRNPVFDAEDMATALKRLGFTVILERNADLRTMREAARRFSQQLDGAQVGLFYYAGHGIQQAGRNYLLPQGHGCNTWSCVPR